MIDFRSANRAMEMNQKGILNLFAGVARVFLFGYDLINGASSGGVNWGSALFDLQQRLKDIRSSVKLLEQNLSAVQAAINELPTVFNTTLERKQVEDLLRRANSIIVNLGPFMQETRLIDDNRNTIKSALFQVNVLLTDYQDIYENSSDKMAISMLTSSAALLTSAGLINENLELRDLERRGGDVDNANNNILSYTEWPFTKFIVSVYDDLLSDFDNEIKRHGGTDTAVFPHRYTDTKTRLASGYRFENGKFVQGASGIRSLDPWVTRVEPDLRLAAAPLTGFFYEKDGAVESRLKEWKYVKYGSNNYAFGLEDAVGNDAARTELQRLSEGVVFYSKVKPLADQIDELRKVRDDMRAGVVFR